MSYRAELRLPTGAGNFVEIDVRSVTYNNAPIFAQAFGDQNFSLRDFNGKRAKEAIPSVRIALSKIIADPDSFKEAAKKADAANWGGIEDSKSFLTALIVACEVHPDMEIHIS